MSKSNRPPKQQADPLAKWLALNWDRPERSYNPDVRDFLAALLDYPKERVVTEDSGGGGYPDIKLLTSEKIAWVVGDLKKDDAELTSKNGRAKLWNQKRKYVEGLTRYVLFLTAHYLWIVLPNGEPVEGLENPLDLSGTTFEQLKETLKFISSEQAEHNNQWASFIEGKLPYVYLKLDDPDTLDRLRQDLQTSFAELSEAGEQAISRLQEQYKEYKQHEQQIQGNLVGAVDSQRRAFMRLRNKFSFERYLFDDILPQFEDQYGREVSAKNNNQAIDRIREAFVADSVAVLIARVLFLRLVEDLELTKKRRLSNGGPQDWAAFVDQLTGDARALVRLVAEDVGRLYKEPFERNVFDWLYQANGILDTALQRLILRFNAYDFSGLSEEILGDIYQAFLPTAKRKRLGEFYTPPSIVDWLLEQTIFSHGDGKLLDPSCGSGSFLVRYVHRCLEDAKTRGLSQDEVLQELQTNVWGFDLNPFAAFISHFQLMWAMLRFKPVTEPPNINVYNINSLLKDADLVPILGEGFLPPGSKERDSGQWKYILGNPPYIRGERVKYGEEMRGLWQQVWGQNSDTGLVFLYRALTESLESGGFLGMVVSGGYANSEAAAKVWKLLYPRQEAALRKLVWLEFTDRPIWDVARIPLIVVIEKTPAQDDDEIELYVPSTWPSDEPPVKVKYKDFFDYKVNPRVTEETNRNTREGLYGEYLLALLHPEDVPILKKLYPNGNGGNIVGLKEAVAQQISRNNRPFWWTYGIQRGGTEVTSESTGVKPIQVIAGRSLAVGWHGEAAGWVDLEAVKNRPNGKLSLWAERTPEAFIIVSELAKAPFASVVKGTDFAAVNTVIVAVPKANNPSAEAVAAYLNSKLARYYWALRLRSGVIQGYYAHVYPRTLESMPWVRNLDAKIEQQLVDSYNNLAQLAAIAKNNPDEWLLSEVETRIETSRYKLSDRTLGLNFSNWSTEDVQVEELNLDGNLLRAGLFSIQLVDANLAELVYKLLTLNSDEDTSISRSTIQKLLVPQNYANLMQEYRQRQVSFQQVESNFFEVLDRIDSTVYEMFGITDEEKEHIETRLAIFPLNKLQPRYPWQTVRPRPIKAYTEDRFV
ncbi:HsdM family class I SAM-dependent methyltransferase [Argonema galeatum]|uniref:HsdM family class I SAM-dependent methyltransferase n=1 Tax=Argonema galeatum TaxID=2942762 RepID=UPI002011A763|nr:N-6 DNA methylase [Argonema galeatum]MCL1466286.1 N-6 DNA methylase [Argonema galeatum A003/A1]